MPKMPIIIVFSCLKRFLSPPHVPVALWLALSHAAGSGAKWCKSFVSTVNDDIDMLCFWLLRRACTRDVHLIIWYKTQESRCKHVWCIKVEKGMVKTCCYVLIFCFVYCCVLFYMSCTCKITFAVFWLWDKFWGFAIISIFIRLWLLYTPVPLRSQLGVKHV